MYNLGKEKINDNESLCSFVKVSPSVKQTRSRAALRASEALSAKPSKASKHKMENRNGYADWQRVRGSFPNPSAQN